MLEIAMALRLKGIASNEHVAEVTGQDQETVDEVLGHMIAKSYAQETPRGLRLLPEGKVWVDSLLEEERENVDQQRIEAIYEDFCSHNDDFKQLVTDWQIKEVAGEQQLNDHEDANYDAGIITRLNDLDEVVKPVFASAAELAPRLARYIERFANALNELQAGDHSYLAAPLKDSYHTVWFEMHEELILLCGRNRADEAAAGRGA
tara:strand:+ start:1552 stop:2166 length:615 start_codon:yes stop_codon:yes gene_type:complete